MHQLYSASSTLTTFSKEEASSCPEPSLSYFSSSTTRFFLYIPMASADLKRMLYSVSDR